LPLGSNLACPSLGPGAAGAIDEGMRADAHKSIKAASRSFMRKGNFE
jgi:hypothetical protein